MTPAQRFGRTLRFILLGLFVLVCIGCSLFFLIPMLGLSGSGILTWVSSGFGFWGLVVLLVTVIVFGVVTWKKGVWKGLGAGALTLVVGLLLVLIGTAIANSAAVAQAKWQNSQYVQFGGNAQLCPPDGANAQAIGFTREGACMYPSQVDRDLALTAQPSPIVPATGTPVVLQPTLTAGAPLAANVQSSWLHNPVLPAPQGYPGVLEDAGDDQNDTGHSVVVEIGVQPNQIVLITGDSALIPPLGQVGGQNATAQVPFAGCYMIVARGPIVWDTQPTLPYDMGVITFQSRSGWDLHTVDTTADPMVWAAEKAKALAEAWPATCGVNIDTWVYSPTR